MTGVNAGDDRILEDIIAFSASKPVAAAADLGIDLKTDFCEYSFYYFVFDVVRYHAFLYALRQDSRT